MTVSLNKAIAAYAGAPKVTDPGGLAGEASKVAPGMPQAGQTDFAGMVKAAVRNSIDVAKTGEQMSAQALTGQASINEVVTAVAEAEVTLQAVVTIRDKVMDAYKEISRMPI